MKKLLAILAVASAGQAAQAWDGYDYEAGNHVEVERGQLVRTGREIEYYDYGSGSYRTGDVESINRYGGSVELEVYDHESGETRTFEMDD